MKKFKCPTCGTEAWAPDALMEVAQMDSKISFYCAYGHSSHFKMNKKEFEETQQKALPPPTSESESKETDILGENVVAFPKRGG